MCFPLPHCSNFILTRRKEKGSNLTLSPLSSAFQTAAGDKEATEALLPLTPGYLGCSLWKDKERLPNLGINPSSVINFDNSYVFI